MTAPGAPMRIVIAEDSAVVRAGLVEILADRGHEVLAAVGDACVAAGRGRGVPTGRGRGRRAHAPGYTDEGLRAAIAIRRAHPGIGVLVFSQYIETRYAADLLGAAPGGGGAPESGTCSRTGSPTSMSSLTRSAGWPRAAPRSTRRWSPS